jgi:hypothetical protein
VTGEERATLGAAGVVLAVWRQAVIDLRDDDPGAWGWLDSPAFDQWALLFDPSLDPHILRAALRRAFGRGEPWQGMATPTPSLRRSALTAARRA